MLAIWLVLFIGVLCAFASDSLGGIVLIVGTIAALSNILINGSLGGLIPLIVLFGVDGILFIYSGWRQRRLRTDAL